ncbi:redox-sensitive transcriptional activator SoxR [Caenispirillum bisanense]|uniref:redox-sensitive transcriptional activator SoxR n=1 Tax=Caenispirillum bisanense TaxID=414052 RepID=UPI0031DD7C65
MNRRTPAATVRELTVGEVSRRAGVPVSTLHFYEARGLIRSARTGGNQRRYPREVLRRIAVIRVAQRAGVPLAEVREALATLPDGRTPTAEDWAVLAAAWHERLEERIRRLTRLRDLMGACLGCGCLSVAACPLHNPDDRAGDRGPGPRFIEEP